MVWLIEEEPQGKVYQQLIDLAFDACDEFHLVVRRDLGSTRKLEPVLKQLESSLKRMENTNEWTGTRLGGGQKAKVFYYHADDHARKVVKKAANSLYSWLQPELPEDLSFLKKGEPWLVTIAHEEESYIVTKSEYWIKKLKGIEGLKLAEDEK